MKAFRLYGDNDVRMVDVELPEPGPRQARVKVAATGVCGSDVHGVEQAERWGYPLPYTLGHETVGWVDAIGDDDTHLQVGDAVAVYPLLSCERCPNCAEGRVNQCRTRLPFSIGAGADGGMAEFVIAPAENLVPIGALDPVEAAPLTDAGMTSYNAVAEASSRLAAGARVVVIGVGGLGHVALQILAAESDALVIAVDLDDSRLDQAKTLGAWETVRSDASAGERIAQLCEGIGAEVVIDFVGTRDSVALACGVVASGGKLVMVGLGDGVVPVKLGGILPQQVEAVVPLAGSRADLEAVISLAQRGAVHAKVSPFPLADAEDVLRQVHGGEILGRAVLIP